MIYFFRNSRRLSKTIPDGVFVELIDILFAPLLPVIVMGVTVLAIGLLIATMENDAIVAALTIGAAMISGTMALLTLAYRARASTSPFTVTGARMWERRCAGLCFAFAISLGALCVRAIAMGDPLAAMLTTGLIFGYGAGLVARRAVRPAICIPSLILATLPAVIGFGMHLNMEAGIYAMAAYVAQMLLIAGFTVASLETVAFSYQTTLQQLITKRDLGILARQDDLTGLANRFELRTRFNAGVGQAGDLLAFHSLDLDRFKSVNDTLGHPVGDELLRAVAGRLARSLQAGDTVARLGGDEFAVLQIGIHHADEARLLARRLIRIISEPYSLRGHEVHIGVSIGIAVSAHEDGDLERLILHADSALYRAKHAGRNTALISGEDLPLAAHPMVA